MVSAAHWGSEYDSALDTIAGPGGIAGDVCRAIARSQAGSKAEDTKQASAAGGRMADTPGRVFAGSWED